MSGGTGGVSVFTYNTDTGVLQSNASIRNQDLGLGDIGYPDVTLVTPKLAALSTDARNEATSFGVTMANIDLSQSTLSRRQFFPVEDTVGFNYAIGPANFPCTSSVYTQNGESYLYVANGPLTVQNVDTDSTRTVSDLPTGFEALTVSVNSRRRILVVGGVTNNGLNSAYVVFDISDPLEPVFVYFSPNARNDDGRITSIASAGNNIVYVKDGSSEIGHDLLNGLLSSLRI